jgi:ubiquinone/menaquinone biosynthesis C-methylase UbiE
VELIHEGNDMLSQERCIFIRHLFAFLASALFACASITAIWAGQASQVSASKLTEDLANQYSAGNFEQALKTAEQIIMTSSANDMNLLYRVATLHCLLGHKEEAYMWLQKAIDAGYGSPDRLNKDNDFKSIRDEDRFKKVVARANINRYLAMLERPEREGFQKKEEIMTALALKPGERVADIGAGSGYFTIPVAKAVSAKGVVWAIDIRQEMLDYIAKRLKGENLENVKPILVTADDPQLPPGGVDTILMVDTIHYVQNKGEYANKLRLGLAPGGRVVIIDYIPKPMSERPWGPLPEQQLAREKLDAYMAEAELKLIKAHNFLTEQYFVEYGIGGPATKKE